MYYIIYILLYACGDEHPELPAVSRVIVWLIYSMYFHYIPAKWLLFPGIFAAN